MNNCELLFFLLGYPLISSILLNLFLLLFLKFLSFLFVFFYNLFKVFRFKINIKILPYL